LAAAAWEFSSNCAEEIEWVKPFSIKVSAVRPGCDLARAMRAEERVSTVAVLLRAMAVF
jgi:hypothetical protein